MTYAETIQYLYEKLPVFSRIGDAAIKKDLTNTQILCSKLGDPHHHFRSIHVAGTNGKGSTSHMLASILQSAGYRTGLYTSPHLHDFRERFRINGEMIPENFITSFVENNRTLIEEVQPSFFEVTVALAFDYFAKEKVDIAVIETGLGGRLDSTNVITPVLSVITNIGFDHMQLLGNTLDRIAFEKAGIIKQGIPAVIGEYISETRTVFEETAKQKKAPIRYAQDELRIREQRLLEDRLEVSVSSTGTDNVDVYTLDLPGRYQTHNLLTVLTAVEQLREDGWVLPHDAVSKGLSCTRSNTGLAGRWERIRREPDVIIDVAHNKDGIGQVIKQLQTLTFKTLHWILGVVKDKDVSGMLSLLPQNANYYFTRAQIPRAMDTEQLQTLAASFSLNGTCHDTVQDALNAALAKALKDDLILICGSVYVAGEIDRSIH
jgi:dihydrofolate synthase/folylpolyglutamate synthase